ncbi:MAG: hypothetical protein HKO53_14185, partial [Gemmatimonadetes bacterium]|nr:hypothetical protein [Gemmatimonadota bacterium]
MGRLLRLYPREFREQFGPELEAMASALLREAGRSPRERRRVWRRVAWDAATQGSIEHLNQWGRRLAGPRATPGAGMMEEWTRQVRFAIRKLGRTPTMTAIALLTLALGIGANVGIFSIVNAVLLRPLPFDEPDRLVGMWHVAPGLGFDQVNSNPAAYFTYREEGTVFEDVALWDNRTASVTGLDQPEQVEVLAVTDGLFPILRVQATLGRIFSREDDLHGSPETVMLSFDYWQTRFGGDPGVLGRSLEVQG